MHLHLHRNSRRTTVRLPSLSKKARLRREPAVPDFQAGRWEAKTHTHVCTLLMDKRQHRYKTLTRNIRKAEESMWHCFKTSRPTWWPQPHFSRPFLLLHFHLIQRKIQLLLLTSAIGKESMWPGGTYNKVGEPRLAILTLFQEMKRLVRDQEKRFDRPLHSTGNRDQNGPHVHTCAHGD